MMEPRRTRGGKAGPPMLDAEQQPSRGSAGRVIATANDMRASYTFSLLCAACIGLGSTARVHAQADHDVRIVAMATAHGVVDRKPDRPASVFTPDDNPIFVWFRAEGCAIGTTITSVWYYDETDPPLRFSTGAVTVDVLDDWGQFNFELAPGKRWPLGAYHVELRVGDERLADAAFAVSPPPTP